jgi:hypothetical protein
LGIKYNNWLCHSWGCWRNTIDFSFEPLLTTIFYAELQRPRFLERFFHVHRLFYRIIVDSEALGSYICYMGWLIQRVNFREAQ